MHEKKNGKKSYGGIEKKYEHELAQVMFGSITLVMAAGEVLKELHRDDSDHGDIQTGWLNGPYQLMQKLEHEVADLEAKVKDDPQFSDRFKQIFMSELIDPVKEGSCKAREIDAYVMSGIVPPAMRI